jgi:major type 1 subunit fimbrin (pilin)
MKNVMKISALALGLATTGIAQSSTGTITFNGQLTANTCSAAVNGAGPSATVTLPTISISDLNAAGKTAGKTRFQIALSGCSANTSVAAFFEETPGATDIAGRLINSGTATNVSIELNDIGTSSTRILVGQESQISKTIGWYTIPTTGTQTMNYSAQYYANGTTTAGTVTSKVNYTLMYK